MRRTRTFLAGDIVGSTQRWSADEAAMSAALAEFDATVDSAVSGAGGEVFKHTGDGFFAAFEDPAEALVAAIAAQEALDLETRMAVATGPAERREGDWFGGILSRAARLMDAASGGQVLVGEATAGLVRDSLPAGVSLVALGRHRFRDLHEPYDVFQLAHPSLADEFPPIRSLDAFAHNLPVQMTSFVGREAEVQAVVGLVEDHRLVTLTGVGGVGKTRLALAAAATVLDRYPGGAWFVELASIAEPGLIATETMTAMGAVADGRDPVEIVIGRCQDPTLIVLDNCEHLIDDAAKFAEDLLRGASAAVVMATSREGLGVMGEALYRVPSLRGTDGLDEAVRLFGSRARLVDPDFVVDESNRAAVEQICGRLDGIPLAIELATARLRVLDPAGIAERLDDRFRFLTGGARTALPRQRTLAATMDWSYELLSDKEQVMLRRLAVFAGGFDIEASEAVCADSEIADFEVLDLLDRLVAASLVTSGDRGRFRMLETVRQYAADKLLASGEVATWRDRHAAFFASVADEVNAGLLGPEADRLMERLLADHDNFRLAMTHSLEAGDPDRAGRIATGLYRFWQSLSNWSEAREWYRRLVDRVSDPTLRGWIANGLAMCSVNLGEPEEAKRWHALQDELLPEPVGPPLHQAQWHHVQGSRLQNADDLRGAYAAFIAAGEIAAESVPEYVPPVWMAAQSGAFLEDVPGYEEVVARLEAITREADQDEHLAYAWSLLSLAKARLGDFEESREAHDRALEHRPDDRQSQTTTPTHAASVWFALRDGDAESARRHLAMMRRAAEAAPAWNFNADQLEVRVEVAAGRPGEALAAASRALDADPPGWPVRLSLVANAALALEAAGDASTAAAVLAGVRAEESARGVRTNPWDREVFEAAVQRLAAAGVAADPLPLDDANWDLSKQMVREAVERALDDA